MLRICFSVTKNANASSSIDDIIHGQVKNKTMRRIIFSIDLFFDFEYKAIQLSSYWTASKMNHVTLGNYSVEPFRKDSLLNTLDRKIGDRGKVATERSVYTASIS